MLIVSQDKEKIINFDNVLYIEIDDTFSNNEISFNTENGTEYMGEYKTRERAKEVLEDITDAYLRQNVQKISPIDINIMQKKIAYVMPKE